MRDELVERLKTPVNVLSRLLRNPGAVFTDIRDGLSAISESIGAARMASATPFNRPIGPHRQFDWLSMDISALREVRHRLGGSFNDVVLAVVAGAVRRFLLRRKLGVTDLDVPRLRAGEHAHVGAAGRAGESGLGLDRAICPSTSPTPAVVSNG